MDDADDDEDNDVSNRFLFDRRCYNNTESCIISMFDVVGAPHRKTSGLSSAIKGNCFEQCSIRCKLSRRKLLQ